ncbi:MAG: hypothetical protein M9899_02280 [Bdellovibrionaceae bacterium]|nr:hypothetical protein [Pseudobdellovibrionaceae bacterium]
MKRDNLIMTVLLCVFLLFVTQNQATANEDFTARVIQLLTLNGAQGEARLNPKVVTDDGSGTCQLSFTFLSSDRVVIDYDFQLSGFFNDLYGSDEFQITQVDTDPAYGDFSMRATSASGVVFSLTYMKPRTTFNNPAFVNGHFHFSIKTSPDKVYDCHDDDPTKSSI